VLILALACLCTPAAGRDPEQCAAAARDLGLVPELAWVSLDARGPLDAGPETGQEGAPSREPSGLGLVMSYPAFLHARRLSVTRDSQATS